MSERKDNDEPAFPTDRVLVGYKHRDVGGAPIYEPRSGMTLRDYFAGQALAGMTSKPGWLSVPDAVEAAYRYADAMLAVRDRK